LLEENCATRNTDFDKYEQAYLLKLAPDISSKLERANASAVVAPDARNVILGCLRLMVSTDPVWKVKIPNTQPVNGDAEKIENSLRRWWTQSGRIARKPVHYDIVLSSLLYGTAHTQVSDVAEMAKLAPQNMSKRIMRRANIAPYLIESLNPKTGFPSFDQFGLNKYYKKITTTNGYITSTFANAPASLQTASSTGEAILNMWYDLENYFVWTGDTILASSKHGMSEIPIMVTQVDGSSLFSNQEDQHQPILYTMIKSGLYDQQNMGMSVMFAMTWALGLNPMFQHKAPSDKPEKPVDVSFDTLGGTIELEGDETYTAFDVKNAVTPAVKEAYGLAQDKGRESSISPQAFGTPMDRQSTFSENSLMGQAGRLPLIGPAKMGGSHIAGIAELAILMLKEKGNEGFSKNGIELVPSEIPDIIDIDVELEVKLPQDRLQLANIASILKRDGLVDDEWIQNNILGVSNTKETRAKIWKQEASKQMFGVWLQSKIEEKQQADRMAREAIQNRNAPPVDPNAPPEGQGAGAPQPNMVPPTDALGAMADASRGVTPNAEFVAPGLGPTPSPAGQVMQGGLPQAQRGMVLPPQGPPLPGA
jgi:hypothetical protein